MTRDEIIKGIDRMIRALNESEKALIDIKIRSNSMTDDELINGINMVMKIGEQSLSNDPKKLII